jgi:four helix bundle protein
MNNIAEGFERKGNRELKNYLFIAKGSCAEVRSMLYLSHELGYVAKADVNNLLSAAEEVSRLLSGFIKTL